MGDDEDDAHEGDEGDDQGGEEGGGQEGAVRNWQEECRRYEEEGDRYLRAEEAQPCVGVICGGTTMPRTEVTKKIWVYIKKYKLNDGRTIKPDAKLKAVLPVASLDMLKMASYVSKHLS